MHSDTSWSAPVRGGRNPGSCCSHTFQSLPFLLPSPKAPKTEVEKLEFERCPTPSNFEVWKMNFKKVCSGASYPSGAIIWINENESALPMDDLKTSESTATCLIASAHSYKNGLGEEVYMEETKAQKDKGFQKGRQIAFMKSVEKAKQSSSLQVTTCKGCSSGIPKS